MDNIQNKIEELREQIEQLETIRHKQEQEKKQTQSNKDKKWQHITEKKA